ncbi:MAG: PAS-domain containing protein, partial [Beijerinckiaceae bacterium]
MKPGTGLPRLLPAGSILAAIRNYLRSHEISFLIGGGIAVLVLVILFGAVSAILGLRTIAAGHARQQSFAAVVQTAAAIDEHLLRLRVAASEYLMSGRALDRNRMIDASQALKSRVEAGSLVLREVGFGEVVDAIRERLDLQRGVIDTLGDLRERRARISDAFVTLGDNGLKILDEIVPRAFEFGDFEGSNRALRVRENLHQSQSEVLVWLINRSRTPMAPISERWNELNAAVRRLQLTLREQRDRESAANLRTIIEPQGQLIVDLDAAAQDESMLDRILDQENGLVQGLSDQLRARAAQGEAELVANVNQTFEEARFFTVLFALASVGLGLLGSGYIFRRTVRPIRRITTTLGSLASGKLDTKVPFALAHHEIGQMARAADVFKTAMAEVDRTRAVFQTVIDNLPDGVMLYDKDLRTLMWNHQIAEFGRLPDTVVQTGTPAEEILRIQAERGDFGPGDIKAQIEERIAVMKTPGGIRYHRRAQDGRFIEFNFKPLPGGQLLGYYRDLTEMKENEEAARAATETLQSVIDNLPDAVMLFDKDKRWVMWNRQLAELQRFPDSVARVGASAEEILLFQARRGDFGPGVPEEQVKERVATMWTPGGVRYHRRAASGRYIEFNFKPLPDGRLLGHYRDLTEMKEIEEEVRTARERLQSAIEGLASGFALYDSDDRLVIWNKRFEEYAPDIGGQLKIGMNYAEIVRASAARGKVSEAVGRENEWVAERLAYHRRPEGVLLRRLPDGRWIQLNKRRAASGDLVSIYTDITEIKQKEEQVTKATERLQNAIEGLTSGFALYDSEDRLVIWNKRFEEFTPGVAEFLVVGSRFEDIVRAAARKGRYRDAVGREEEWIAQRLAYHHEPEGYLVNQLPDGRWIQLNKRRAASGDMVSVFTDITEIKQKEEAVTKATELLQDAIEGLGSGFAIYDENDRLLIWNERYEEFTRDLDGFRKAGAHFADMLKGALAAGQINEAKGREEEWLAHRLAHHANPTYRLVRAIDDNRWVHVEKQRTKANHVVSVFTDITDLKKSEEAVREATARLQDAIENLGSGFVLCDPDTRLIVWNTRLMELLPGLDDELKPGARFGDVLRTAIDRGILVNTDMKSEEWIADRRLGRRSGVTDSTVETSAGRWMRMTRQSTANGNTVAIFIDITELKHREIELDRLVVALETARDAANKARADAEAANQAKSTFLATMSHEIRTPMNGVLGMLEVLEHGVLQDRQRTQVRLARQSAMSLLHIIDDVLDFSKIEAGRLELESVDLDVLALVEGVAETMTESTRRKGLALYGEVDPLLPETIVGDPTRLRQILFNLVGNAIKFTEQGSVSIVAESIARDGRAHMRLAVADTGIGMTKEQRERLFKPFEQADVTTTRRFGGTGLGLSIVARLVDLMGGEITAQSAPGHGSVFTVEIPVKAGRRPTEKAASLSGVAIAVLMADSDAAKRLGGHLARAGAAVHVLTPNVDDEDGAAPGGMCDVLVAERALADEAAQSGRLAEPRRRIFLDGWEAGKTSRAQLSVPMPWRVENIVAAVGELFGREIKAPRHSAPAGASDRWVQEMSGRSSLMNGAPDVRDESAQTANAEGRRILVVDDHPVNREVIRRQLELIGHDADEAENGSVAFAL